MTPLLFLILSLVVFINADDSCRFALKYSTDDLVQNSTARQEFLESVLYWEGMFHQNLAGLNAATGLTYDGHALNYTTGELVPPLHYWSAPSKESIHLGLLALALSPERSQDALNFFHVPLPTHLKSKWNTGDYRLDTVLAVLERKIASYEKWNEIYPGFGGFIPWVYLNDSGMVPIPDQWSNRVPGLDNGEMIWGMYAVIQVLKLNDSYSDLLTRYENYFQILINNAKTVFYDGNGFIRSVTRIANVSAQPTPSNYQVDCFMCYLDDPYEGELLAVFLDLFAEWENDEERDQIWINKRPLLQSVDYPTPKGNITVQRGWWFSSHEQWKYLMLPYLQVPINRRVFLNGERARTWNSYLKSYAGMFASVTNVTTAKVFPDYLSATGIPEIAFEPIAEDDVVTPYASFPTFLANPACGFAWYHNMLAGPRMQGPYGSTESVNLSGTEISPVVTWDSKITTVLGMLGGVHQLNGQGLIREGKFDRFYKVINREWSLKFPVLHGENFPLVLPEVQIPRNKMPDFPSCESFQFQ